MNNPILGFAMSLLLAAIVLWGAIHIIETIFVPLAVTAAVVVFALVIFWVISARFRRW